MMNVNFFYLFIIIVNSSCVGIVPHPKTVAKSNSNKNNVGNDMKTQVSTYFILKDKKNSDTVAITGVRLNFEFNKSVHELKSCYIIQNDAISYCSMNLLKANPTQRQNGDMINLTFFIQLQVPPSNTYTFGLGFKKNYSPFDRPDYAKTYINVAGGQMALECNLVFNCKSMVLLSQSFSFMDIPGNPYLSTDERESKVISLSDFIKNYVKTEVVTQIVWTEGTKPSVSTGFMRN